MFAVVVRCTDKPNRFFFSSFTFLWIRELSSSETRKNTRKYTKSLCVCMCVLCV